MNSVKIKLCGITNTEDAKLIVDLDFDFIGLIFVESSPRYVSLSVAKEIYSICKGRKKIVGIFQNQNIDFINNIVKSIKLDFLQFHGNEDISICENFSLPYIKTISVNQNGSLSHNIHDYNSSNALLFDTKIDNQSGGTGKTFDWELLHKNEGFHLFAKTNPFFISGGLNPDNVSKLILNYKPWGIDVSSGLEYNARKKDITLVKKFLENVRIAENSCEKD